MEESEKATPEGTSFKLHETCLGSMHGNVWEWCEDDYHRTYEGASSDGSAWVESNWAKTDRLPHDGSRYDDPEDCWSACRGYRSRDDHLNRIGFRVCCVVPRTLLSP